MYLNPGPPDFIGDALNPCFTTSWMQRGPEVRKNQIIDVFIICAKVYGFSFFSAAVLVIPSSVLLSDLCILLLLHSLYLFLVTVCKFLSPINLN